MSQWVWVNRMAATHTDENTDEWEWEIKWEKQTMAMNGNWMKWMDEWIYIYLVLVLLGGVYKGWGCVWLCMC